MEIEISRFLTSDGRVARWPSRRADRLALLAHLAGRLAHGVRYREREVNDLLADGLAAGVLDAAFVRRMLYDERFVDRTADGSAYWRREDAPPAN